MLRSAFLCLMLVWVAACGGASAASSDGEEPRTISNAWVYQRPSMSPWGPDTIPANRKPRWFCRTEPEQPALSSCARTEESCKASPGEAPCDPHARAACVSPGEGSCFPTLAICEAARAGTPKRAAVAVAADPARLPSPRPSPPPSPSPRPSPPSRAVVAADPPPEATCAWFE